jgi:hypothetical protein
MAKNTWRITRVSLEWGAAIAAMIALLQGTGSLQYVGDIALIIVGGLAATVAVFEHGWYRAPNPVGTPIRTAIFLSTIWGTMIFIGYIARPMGQVQPTGPKGFVQFGDAWFYTKEISANAPLAINLSMMNKGNTPVDDLYPYFAATVAPTGPDPDATDRKTHADFLKGALTYQEQLINDGKAGRPLGKGESFWSTLTFPSLNDDQAQGVLSGQVRLYVYAWARWRDAPRDLDNCIWLQPPPTPDVSDFKKLIWHLCAE